MYLFYFIFCTFYLLTTVIHTCPQLCHGCNATSGPNRIHQDSGNSNSSSRSNSYNGQRKANGCNVSGNGSRRANGNSTGNGGNGSGSRNDNSGGGGNGNSSSSSATVAGKLMAATSVTETPATAAAGPTAMATGSGR